MNVLKRIITKLESSYYKVFKIPTMKQELLVRLALKEKGVALNKLNIKCNHDHGINYINGLKFGIKYPESFFLKTQNLITKEKEISFYFNGNMSDSGQRAILLEPFINLPKAKIISSNEGRVNRKKNKFNSAYFTDFANSKFGLCPHQVNWIGSVDHMWTYRFIESCFAGAIPVLFKKTPLGEEFIKGFNFVWDDEIISNLERNDLFDPNLVKDNISLAKERFCFTDSEIKAIFKTL